MAQNKKSRVIKWLLVIAAVVLLGFICWKAGWILNGNKNEASVQEKKEAIQEAIKELNEGLQDAQDELKDELQEMQEELRID